MDATNIVRGNLAQLLSLNVLIPDLREVTIHNISMHVQVTGTEVPLGLTMYSVTPDDALDLPLIPGRGEIAGRGPTKLPHENVALFCVPSSGGRVAEHECKLPSESQARSSAALSLLRAPH